MSSLRAIQYGFMDWLLTGSRAAHPELAGPPQATGIGLEIYANAYRSRLRDTLRRDHAQLCKLLGDAAFDDLADAFVEACPSRHPSLRHLGDDFPDWLARDSACARSPWIAELARFERALMDVFDAAGSARLSLGDLALIPADDWPDVRTCAHPSVRLFETSSACVQLWKDTKAGTPVHDPDALTDDRLRAWVLWRNRERLSEFRPLTGVECALVRALLERASFARLCDLIAEHMAAEDVSAHFVGVLRGWIDAGLLATSPLGLCAA